MKYWQEVLLKVCSYVLVAVLSSFLTLCICLGWFPGFGSELGIGQSKLEQLELRIEQMYIGDVDKTVLEDAAASAMVKATGDKWSYYVPAAEYEQHLQNKDNVYVGIGITIAQREDNVGFDILQVQSDGPAEEAGILQGDILTHVDGQRVAELGVNGTSTLIRGESGTYVTVTVMRDGKEMDFDVERRTIDTEVATGTMLEGNTGYIKIVNFNSKCARQTIEQIETLVEQGAERLIFDVRYNPGGYTSEMNAILDYLLPEGPLFRSVDYSGWEDVVESDSGCLELPMAVLINGDSYSAAEFFAAALDEYDWAILVGQPTTGKSHFQYTLPLNDGSAVVLSTGKYTTPNGVVLADVGGLKPEVPVEVDTETYAMLRAGLIQPEEDPQIQAAIAALERAG